MSAKPDRRCRSGRCGFGPEELLRPKPEKPDTDVEIAHLIWEIGLLHVEPEELRAPLRERLHALLAGEKNGGSDGC